MSSIWHLLKATLFTIAGIFCIWFGVHMTPIIMPTAHPLWLKLFLLVPAFVDGAGMLAFAYAEARCLWRT